MATDRESVCACACACVVNGWWRGRRELAGPGSCVDSENDESSFCLPAETPSATRSDVNGARLFTSKLNVHCTLRVTQTSITGSCTPFSPPYFFLSQLSIMPDSIASLDSVSSDDSYDDDEEEELRLAQQEWEESLEQLQQLVAVVLLPFLGKFLGRRWSHWGMSPSVKLISFGSHAYITTPSVCPLSQTWPRNVLLPRRENTRIYLVILTPSC